ncbi:hypothetical protein PFISCL1PPCAC_8479, partial [Pristionchus fissidentatus]
VFLMVVLATLYLVLVLIVDSHRGLIAQNIYHTLSVLLLSAGMLFISYCCAGTQLPHINMPCLTVLVWYLLFSLNSLAEEEMERIAAR